SYAAHECPKSGAKNFQAVICPLCSKSIRLSEMDDPHAVWEAHSRNNCDPAQHKSKKPKERCSAPTCREVLGLTNRHRCTRCGKADLCLKCRYPDRHDCPAAAGGRGGAVRSIGAAAGSATAGAVAARLLNSDRGLSVSSSA
ncbi:unnamed protein product, partial [Phaeothamnion confervicola]